MMVGYRMVVVTTQPAINPKLASRLRSYLRKS